MHEYATRVDNSVHKKLDYCNPGFLYCMNYKTTNILTEPGYLCNSIDIYKKWVTAINQTFLKTCNRGTWYCYNYQYLPARTPLLTRTFAQTPKRTPVRTPQRTPLLTRTFAQTPQRTPEYTPILTRTFAQTFGPTPQITPTKTEKRKNQQKVNYLNFIFEAYLIFD